MKPEVKCAVLIAYLEGWNQLPLPGYAHDSELLNLEKRIMALECAAGIASLPLSNDSTLAGLAWRLWQVRFKQGATFAGEFSHEYTQHTGMIDDCSISLAGLRRVVDGLDPSLPVLQCLVCTERDDSSSSSSGSSRSSVVIDPEKQYEECLGATVQKLVYMAGRARMFSPSATWTKKLAYVYAAEMSFCIANRRLRGYPYPTPMIHSLLGREPPCAGIPREPPYASIPPPCAGIRPEPLGGRISAPIPKEKAIKVVARSGKFRGFFSRGQWLSKMLFWRSKKGKMDSGSSNAASLKSLIERC
ncbi:hypothetical protein ISF_04722 [Cordyceps fumosorosea ARSEF 2679]|uniref:Uncharacterized protein n=1 Tax=Cordyceps fumosorosea (strain ARSEF 2679) TaxID=1081104 RepID=A0A167WNJ1_CORFA|nr:hypothetical protein ISF_04722 [Cordyceps fumosorosea ARSEF 2679]OAA64013.1 hypothetical protein ISF_04722 [Cordyceps fumosorosea ARSEF 2679]